MKKVLVTNSGAGAFNFSSRKLNEVFLYHLKSIHTNPIISYRELGNTQGFLDFSLLPLY
jgi:FMN-dependent NADH-azoreductase